MSLSEALESEQTRARDMAPEVDDRSGRRVRVVNSPYRFSRAAAGVRGRPAFRGEDNHEVIEELLALRQERIEQLEAAGILSSRLPGRRSSG